MILYSKNLRKIILVVYIEKIAIDPDVSIFLDCAMKVFQINTQLPSFCAVLLSGMLCRSINFQRNLLNLLNTNW